MKFTGKPAALVLLAVIGVAKLPLEQRLSNELHEKQLLETPVELGMRESLGQVGLAASLGGLRSLVASVCYLQAYSAFEDVQWAKVDTLMTLVTQLQPREPNYWDNHSWHMAYNAAAYYQRTEKSEVIRQQRYNQYVQRGVDILHEGLRYLPGSLKLLRTLGTTLADRQSNPREAAEAFLSAYQLGKSDFDERRAAYQLAKLDDHPSQERAYQILSSYYDRGMQKQGTTIMVLLPQLEEKLDIAPEKRRKPMAEDNLDLLRKNFSRIRR